MTRDTFLPHYEHPIRDLRNRFPKVRRLVESHGEVILTEKGKPRYRLTLYTPVGPPPLRPPTGRASIRISLGR